MKLAEFNALCDREWAKPKRGDVVSLILTEASLQELSQDVIMADWAHGTHVLYPPPGLGDGSPLRAGTAVDRVINPVTRTIVKISTKKDGDRESARIRVMGGTYRQTWWPAST